MSDGGESRLSMMRALPSLLMAIAGVLVDATFRSNSFRDRIWAQIFLWLAASLQQGDKDGTFVISNVLIHGTFFLSLTSAALQAFAECQWRTSASTNTQADYSRFLAPSMVLPLIYSWMFQSPPPDLRTEWLKCLALFALAFASLCGWKWTMLRKRRVRQELVGIPTVESIPVFSSSSTSLPEERLWMDWTPSEVLTWIHSFEGDEWSSICGQLAPERIPGSVLDSLDVSSLQSMGVPWGSAQVLVKRISDLTCEYPLSSRTSTYRDRQQDELEVDEWVRNDNRHSLSTDNMQQQTWTLPSQLPAESSANAPNDLPSSDPAMPGELSEEAIQKAKDLFREQFGLELPDIKLRQTGGANEMLPNNEASRYNEDTPATVSEPAAMPVNVPVIEPQSRLTTGLPQDLLDSMPPHVREVAEQQPDLVQMLWKERQRGKRASALGLSRIHQLRMQDPAYAQRFTGAQAAADITGIPASDAERHSSNIMTSDEDDMPDQNSDGERTGLLRKRTTRPQQYEAIR